MSWSRHAFVALIASVVCGQISALAAGPVCPARHSQPLRFVDVFDGPPEELATLVPDAAKNRSGYWELGYVYDANRIVTIRCRYADGNTVDIKLTEKIERCSYKIDAKKTLRLRCK